MHLLLAQSTPTAAALASWMEVLFYLGGFIATVLGGLVALKSLRASPEAGTPQPLIIQEHAGSATKSEIDQLHGRIKREREEMEEKIAELKDSDRRLAEKLDHEIEALQERIDAVPQRVITLLRETKGLI